MDKKMKFMYDESGDVMDIAIGKPRSAISEENNMKITFTDPDEIVESPKSNSVLIFSRKYPEKSLNEQWLHVVVKILNKHGFILTSYRSNMQKRGNLIWRRK